MSVPVALISLVEEIEIKETKEEIKEETEEEIKEEEESPVGLSALFS